MSKIPSDLAWVNVRGIAATALTATGPLTEVTGYRQDGQLFRAEVGEYIVQHGGRYFVYPAAVYTAMFG